MILRSLLLVLATCVWGASVLAQTAPGTVDAAVQLPRLKRALQQFEPVQMPIAVTLVTIDGETGTLRFAPGVTAEIAAAIIARQVMGVCGADRNNLVVLGSHEAWRVTMTSTGVVTFEGQPLSAETQAFWRQVGRERAKECA